jgi:hypothetical protein
MTTARCKFQGNGDFYFTKKPDFYCSLTSPAKTPFGDETDLERA